jgi:hypothetical protein
MLRCGIMHIMSNLRNPRCTACTKCRARQSDRPLKSYHVDHLMWNHGSSFTFVSGTLTDHFSVENDQCSLHDRCRSVMCTEEADRRTYRGSYRTYRADMCTRLCMDMHMCRQTKSISVHKTDLPIARNKRHARYFIDTDEMRFLRGTFSIAAHRLKFLCTLHKKSKSYA